MAGWAGFTDEDLKQIKGTTTAGPSARPTRSTAAKQESLQAKKQKLQQQRELARQRAQEFSQENDSNSPLPPSQRLSQPSTQPQSAGSGASPAKPDLTGGDSGTGEPASPSETVKDTVNGNVVEAISETCNDGSGSDIKELDEQEALSLELSRVEQFRLQQQKMEEENKQRRRLLADAIKHRSKMAKEEAEKLTKVQKELSHLDSLVTADVAIIRDRIEAASIDFLQAQKRYERAEKEFVEAKMALAEKSDTKESLTEHLYAVIQQNETRKAERLAILMKELGLEGESYATPLTVPPLLSFSPINTLHRPHFPPTPTSPPADPHPEEGVSENVCDRTPQGDAGLASPVDSSQQNGEESGSTQAEATAGTGTQGTDKADGTDSDKVKVLDSEDQPEQNPDSREGESIQVMEGDKPNGSCCVENRSPESQDGGADVEVGAT